MSNNAPLPPPDMDDFEATMIRAQNPPPLYEPELQAPPIRNRARPRRGPQREPIFHRDDYRAAIIIITLSFPVGFLGAVLGILLMSHI